MKALILCAGRGERLRPLTDTIPKPMVPINGKPLLEYNILLCKAHGIKDIAINTSYLPEQIKEYFGNGDKWGVNIYYSYEPELLGTSGALNNFKDFLNETFIIIYGDAITDINLTKFIEHHKEKGGILTTALRKKSIDKKPASLVFTNNNLKISKFVEKPSDELFHELCKDFYLSNSGLYIAEPEILKYIPKGFSDFAKDIFPKLLQDDKIYAFMMQGYFREVGKIEKYDLAKNEIESEEIKLSFLQGNSEQTQEKNKAIFLDRDGTINDFLYEPDGKLMSPASLEQLKIMDYAKEGIQEMKKLGFKIIAVSNQPGVAFGYLKEEKLKEINEYLKTELGIDETYSCTHHPRFTGDCECRKPKPGMVLQAAKDLNIDIKKSYIVGDNLSDIEFGNNAGVKKTFRIGVERADILKLQHEKNIFPDFTCKNLLEVAEKLKQLEN